VLTVADAALGTATSSVRAGKLIPRRIALALATVTFATVAAVALAGGKGRLYEFRGELLNASTASVQLQIDGGNHAALLLFRPVGGHREIDAVGVGFD